MRIVDENKRGCCVSLKETQFLLCTNATVYNYKQYNSLWRGNCAAIRKAEHITRHMVYPCVGLWGIIFNALCMLGCLYMITVASLCNLSFYPIEREMPDFATTLLFFTVFLHKFKLLKLIGIICNTSNCLKTTGLLLYILLSLYYPKFFQQCSNPQKSVFYSRSRFVSSVCILLTLPGKTRCDPVLFCFT